MKSFKETEFRPFCILFDDETEIKQIIDFLSTVKNDRRTKIPRVIGRFLKMIENREKET